MDFPFAVCVVGSDGVKVVAGEEGPRGLVGLWKFDDAMAQDNSGLGVRAAASRWGRQRSWRRAARVQNTMAPVPDVGPGFKGYGQVRASVLRCSPALVSSRLSTVRLVQSAHFNGTTMGVIAHQVCPRPSCALRGRL